MSNRKLQGDTVPNAELLLDKLVHTEESIQVTQMLLELSGVFADDALPSLHRGWQNAQAFVDMLDHTYDESGVSNRFVQNILKAYRSEELPRIEAAFCCFLEHGRSRLTAAEIRHSFRALKTWHQAATAWKGKKRALPIRHLLAKRSSWIVLCLLLLMVGSVFKYMSDRNRGYGLRVVYFVKDDFSGKHYFRAVPQLEFNWKQEAPLPEMPKDHWSARWKGCLKINEGEQYILTAGADDGMWVHVDGVLLINNGGRHSFKKVEALKPLGPGIHPFRVDYKEAFSAARAELKWRPVDGVTQSIPLQRLLKPGARGCPAKMKRRPAKKKRKSASTSSKRPLTPIEKNDPNAR